MKTTLDCIPCFVRQTLEAARFASDDVKLHERVLRELLRVVADSDLTLPPPVMGQQIHRTLRRLTGREDPYRSAKERFTRLAWHMLPELSAGLERAADPFRNAVQLAIAGNLIDLGVHGGLTEEMVRATVAEALREPLVGDLEGLRDAIGCAGSVLYLADNAGEIVLDRLLIEQLQGARVTVAVRGAPVINDATLADASAARLAEVAEVVSNGSDAPGTILEDCSRDFQRRFRAADLIIAKGQGNFETLSEAEGPIYFLLKVKCPVIAAHVGEPVGTQLLARPRGPA